MNLDPASLELVSIDGELAFLIRLGRRATDPVPTLEQVRRTFRVKDVGDTVGPFLAEATVPTKGARCRAGMLFELYQVWCEQGGFERGSRIAFKRAMTARGFKQKHSNGAWWLDLALADTAQGSLL